VKTAHLTRSQAYQVMISSELKRNRKPHLDQSCPQGLTRTDLKRLFGGFLPEFDFWMRGQTQSVCNGMTYHHNREHTPECKQRFRPGTKWFEPEHYEGDEFTWRCGYTGTGYYEPTVCVDNPHGVVAYSWDVQRFIFGLPVIDLDVHHLP
jgi:hypothetical protein